MMVLGMDAATPAATQAQTAAPVAQGSAAPNGGKSTKLIALAAVVVVVIIAAALLVRGGGGGRQANTTTVQGKAAAGGGSQGSALLPLLNGSEQNDSGLLSASQIGGLNFSNGSTSNNHSSNFSQYLNASQGNDTILLSNGNTTSG